MSNEQGVHDQIKDLIRNHESEVSLINSAIISSLASLMYSEYIRNFKKTFRPVMKVFVPETARIGNLLLLGKDFTNCVSDTMVDQMLQNPLLSKRLSFGELRLFRPEHIDALKALVEIYIIPNAARYIPSVIRMKFGLDDHDQQTFVENPDLEMFDDGFPMKYHHQFIADETVLQLLMLIPRACSELTECTSNIDIILPRADEEILTIGNQNAISVIHFNDRIILNEKMMELLSFVTDSNFKPAHDPNTSQYHVRSNVYNQLIRGTILPPVTD